MKTINLAILLFTLSFAELAARQSTGNFLGTTGNRSQATAHPRPAPPDYRVVNGQLYNTSQSTLWDDKVGTAQAVDGRLDILLLYGNKWIAVTNLDRRNVVSGRNINFRAMRVGRWVWRDLPMELWDAGTPAAAPPTLTPPPAPSPATPPTPAAQIESLRRQIAALEAELAQKRAALQTQEQLQQSQINARQMTASSSNTAPAVAK